MAYRKFCAKGIAFVKIGLLIGVISSADVSAQIFTSEDSVAIGGYDTVAFFTAGKAVAGDSTLAYSWNNARWYFSSLENQQKFQQDPQRFAPQYGGHCAWGMRQGYYADGDPQAWSIIDDKLYINYNQDVKKGWLPQAPENIKIADQHWAEFQKKKSEKIAD